MSAHEATSFEILLKISQELAASLDLHTVLERVLVLSTSNIGAERASLVVLDNKGKAVDAAMILNAALTATTIEQMQEVITSGLAGWVIRKKQPALINDTQKDDRWISRASTTDQSIPAGKSALCVPVMARENLVGVLTIVHSQANFFTEEHLALQRAIADMAGIAIHNARLYEEIQNARERYYDLFEESVDPVLITDLKGRILEANRQALNVSGYTIEELQHCSIRDLHGIPQEKVGREYEHIPGDGSLTYESDLIKKNRDLQPFEVHVSQIKISDSTCAQWIFHDLKERKELDKMREDLSAMIFHDLRAPLANIISSLEIMYSMLPEDTPDSYKSLFDIASRSAERMQRMISGLLDINRLESGQQIAVKEPTQIRELMQEAMDTIQPMATGKEVTLASDIQEPLPDLMLDENMIRRVLVNLIENASKFSPAGSQVKIGACRKGNLVLVWVDDQGAGIPENARERIFEKFVQLHDTNSFKGLGLGLAFCKLAVQAHGGTIWVENLPKGGSRFIFTLPV